MKSANIQSYVIDNVLVSSSGCWEWKLRLDKDGYGISEFRGIDRRAHRLAYIAFKGVIPSKMVVMHTCDNPSCVNPGHLLVGTQIENIEDCRNKGRGGSYWYPGEENPKSILIDDDVRRIRALRVGNMPYSKIAAEIGCSKTLAVLVATGKRWAHVV